MIKTKTYLGVFLSKIDTPVIYQDVSSFLSKIDTPVIYQDVSSFFYQK